MGVAEVDEAGTVTAGDVVVTFDAGVSGVASGDDDNVAGLVPLLIAVWLLVSKGEPVATWCDCIMTKPKQKSETTINGGPSK